MRNPIISVILPTYNRADMIAQTIHSMMRQNFHDFELIIVNDGSTDHTDSEVLEFTDSRIRYKILEHGGDFGIGALNFGMDLARGEYLTFVSSDNLYFSDYLRTLLEALDDTGADFSFGNFLLFEKETGVMKEFKRPSHLDGPFETYHLAIGYTAGICFLFKKGIFEKIKPYRPGPHSDYDLMARMAIAGAKFARINSILGVNVIHKGQLSETSQAKEDETKIRLMVCDHLKKIKFRGAEELRKKVLEHVKGEK